MSKPDAERALKIYRTFVKQTDQVVRYLSIARHYEHATRLEIPKIKHAPTSLSSSLEEYVKDPDFDVNRRQYLASQESKKNGKHVNGASKLLANKSTTTKASNSQSFPSPKAGQATVAKPQAKGPAPDLIDFFESIDRNQQPMAQTPYQQPQFNAQLPGQATGYSSQNPFLAQQTGIPVGQPFGPPAGPPAGQHTNPFLQMQQAQQQAQQPPQQPPQQQQQPQQQHMQPNFTGAGFGGYTAQPQQSQFPQTLAPIPQSTVASFPSQPQQAFATGVTDNSSVASMNPFRQSMMMTGASTASSFGSGITTPISSQPTSNNPFTKNTPSPGQSNHGYPSNSPFSQPPSSSPFSTMAQAPQQQQQQPSLAPQATGSTNPFTKANFAQPKSSPFSQSPVIAQATGSTNPFRQNAFVNQNTGMGWQQSGQQGTIGGISSDNVETMPIFPRPGMG
jgi:phosphatidylinositol-binding clathrin assembly protein